jgi:hypothetical protein
MSAFGLTHSHQSDKNTRYRHPSADCPSLFIKNLMEICGQTGEDKSGMKPEQNGKEKIIPIG